MKNIATPRMQSFFWMSNDIIDKYAKRIGPWATLVYNVLVRYADSNGDNPLPNKTIANLLGIPEYNVDLGIAKLAQFNLVTITSSEPDGSGDRFIALLAIPNPEDDSHAPNDTILPPPPKRARPTQTEERRRRKATWATTQAAIKSGRLIRPATCSQCGGTTPQIEAHHTDYSKPLDVTWLCTYCHFQAHGKSIYRGSQQ